MDRSGSAGVPRLFGRAAEPVSQWHNWIEVAYSMGASSNCACVCLSRPCRDQGSYREERAGFSRSSRPICYGIHFDKGLSFQESGEQTRWCGRAPGMNSSMGSRSEKAPPPLWQTALVFGLAFFLCAELGRALSVRDTSYVSFWLPGGLYTAVLLLHEPRVWPWLILAALPANLAFDLWHGTKLATVCGFFAANTVEALTGALLVRRFVARPPSLSTIREFFGLALCAALAGTMAGATIGAATLNLSGLSDSYWKSWRTWWASEAMAILLVAPFVLAWFGRRSMPPRRLSRARLAEAALLAILLMASTWHMLVVDLGIMAPYNSRLMVFVVWAGLRFGTRGATAANLLLALVVAFLTAHYLKGITPAQISSGDFLLTMQTFLAMCVLVGLIPALVIGERDQSLARLGESEARFRQLTEASFEGICVSENGRVLDANDQMARMLGCSRADFIGQEITAFIAEEERGTVAAAIRAGREAAYEHRLRRMDGTYLEVEAQARMVDNGGRRIRLTALRDITGRKRLEVALKAGEERLRGVLDALPVAAYTCDPRGHITYFNRHAALIWGQSPQLNDPASRYCGSYKLRRLDGSELPHEECWMAVVLAGRAQMAGGEVVVERPDGARRTVLAHASPLFDTSGVLQGAVNVLMDITEQKRAEQALAASEALLRQFIKHAPAAIAMLDNGMRYLQASDRWLTDYHLHERQIIGLSHYEVFPEVPDRWRDIHRRVLDGAVESCDQDSFPRADGTVDWLQWEVRPWRRGDGSIGGLIMFTQVITARMKAEETRRQLEARLRQAQKMEAIGTLAGGIAHDFNNILGSIITYTEMTKIDNPGNPALQENLQEVLRSGQRAASLVRQILSFSRQQKQERKILQLAPVIKEALKLLRSSLPSSVEIVSEIQTGLPAILADATQIHQVMMNLCVNAAQALSGRPGRLRITLDRFVAPAVTPGVPLELGAGEYVRLVVADNGHGMGEATQKRIFEPFFTTKAPGEGTGLGLSVVHGIVRDHEGVITVESAPGQGTTFVIYLPAADPVEDRAELGLAETPRGHGERILFVDDEPALCEIAEQMLTRLGYRPEVFIHSEEAWRALAREPYAWDLVLTDLTMPLLTGVELAGRIHQLRPALPIILASGYSGMLSAETIEELGIREVAQKPLNFEELARVVHRVLQAGTSPVDAG